MKKNNIVSSIKNFTITIIVINIFLLINIISAQETKLNFKHISIENGLSQNSVYSILHDSKGFMWFGTQDGLNLFDGISFKVIKNDPNNYNSLSDNYITALLEYKQGKLLIGTVSSGLNIYTMSTKNMERLYSNQKNKYSLSDNNITFLYKDRNKEVWIGTKYGLNKFNEHSKSFNRYLSYSNKKGEISNNSITSIFEDRFGVLWVGTENGLNSYDRKTDKFVSYFSEDGNPHTLSSNRISAICEDNNGTLWIGTKDGLNKFDRSKLKFVREDKIWNNVKEIINKSITTLQMDIKNRLWVGTESMGIFISNDEKNSFERYQHNPLDQASISNNNVISIYKDKSDAIWIGTAGYGLNHFYYSTKEFKLYQYDPNKKVNISKNSVYSIIEDNDENLWIGTREGLRQFNRKTKRIDSYLHKPNDRYSISNSNIFSIYPGYDELGDVLWIGTYGDGLNKFDKRTKKIFHYRNIPGNLNSLPSDFVYSVVQDKDGFVWIGTKNGLTKFDYRKNQYINYNNNPLDSNSISSNQVYKIFIDKKNQFWIGTSNGLNLLDTQKGTFKKFIHNSNSSSLSNNRVFAIYEDSDGELWIGTQGGGLNKYNSKKDSFTRITEREGLSNNSIYGILEDENKNLWISTNKGITKYNKNNGTFRIYEEADGLQSNEFNKESYCKTKDGEMFFGGIKGINSFYPSKIKDNSNIPEVVITDFKIFNKAVEVKTYDATNQTNDISYSKELNLSYTDEVFSFEFALLNYILPDKNRYAYKLEGYEKEWNSSDKRNYATYTGIHPGQYIFRVKASNNDGKWNEKGASLIINISPPFWKTTWFIIFIGILFTAIVWLIFKLRIRSVEIQNRKLEIQVNERTKELYEANATKDKFFSIISHDLKSPFGAVLTLIEMLIIDYKNFSEEETHLCLVEIQKSATNTYSLLENLLLWSRNQRGKIELVPEQLNIKSIVDDIFILLKSNANKKSIALITRLPEDIIGFADKNTINTVLLNLISNAIKFTANGGKVLVTAEKESNFIKCAVTDTGIGMTDTDIDKLFKIDVHHSTRGTADEKGTGLGLILCKEFVEKNNGKIWVKSEIGNGSTFIFAIPIFQNS